MKKTDRLVKEMELLEVKNKEINYLIRLLDLKFEEMDRGDITPVKVEMSLDLVAMIRDRLKLAEIKHSGMDKELDQITQYLVNKQKWFKDQEKKKSSIAPRKLLNIKDSDKSSTQIITEN